MINFIHLILATFGKIEHYDFIIGYRNIRNDPLHRLIITRMLRLIILIFWG